MAQQISQPANYQGRYPIYLHLDDETSQAAAAAFQDFTAQHQERLKKIRLQLSGTHRLILDALSYLLHVNSPSLPGWTPDAPEGIQCFQPDRTAHRAIARLTPTHRPRNHNPDPQIDALFIMGSAGSVGQTKSSDLDIWVCLAQSQHAAIATKLAGIEAWALEQGLELQIFTVDAGLFSTSRDPAYSSLILDEFYRTGCWVAGRYPAWWLVPSQASGTDYADYLAKLAKNRFIVSDAFLDFGPVRKFDARSLLVAAVREFKKSLHTPHKSLLKLALLESYANGADPLADLSKDDMLGKEFDAYIALIQHLDRWYAFDNRRRAFLRKAWLTKVTRGNARLASNPIVSEIAQTFEFSSEALQNLRWPEVWSLQDLIRESDQFKTAYRHVARFLSNLLARADLSDAEEFQAISSALDQLGVLCRDNGRLHPGAPDNHVGTARITKQHGEWALVDHGHSVCSHNSRLGLLAWLHQRGLTPSALDPNDRDEPWIRATWPILLQADDCMILNTEPANNRDKIRSAHTLSSGMVRMAPLAEAIAQSATHNLTVHCVDDLRADLISKEIQGIVDQIREHATDEGTLCLAVLNDQLLTWRAQNGLEVIGEACADLHRAVRDIGCYGEILQCGDVSASPRWQAVQSLLLGPTLWVQPLRNGIELIYRDTRQQCQIVAPARSTTFFIQSLRTFMQRLADRNVQIPSISLGPSNDPIEMDDPDEPLGLVLKQTDTGWQTHLGPTVWAPVALDRRLLKRLRDEVLNLRDPVYRNVYPVHLTDIRLQKGDFLSHLLAKIRLEKAIANLAGAKPGTGRSRFRLRTAATSRPVSPHQAPNRQPL